MKNDKFIIYNKTERFSDYEIFNKILGVLGKGLISGDNNLYCYSTTYFHERVYVHIEFIKTNYGYKIYAIEEVK